MSVAPIYMCVYASMWGADCFGEGWKRIDLKDEWFISQENVAKWHRINK